ncbi:MAG: methionyl-tRNA formyltransferase [Candidatus Dormibacteria bacterium]
MLRLAFLGTAEFAVPSLRACAEQHEVVRVVTQPERPGHRGAPAPRPVADVARELGLPVEQPRRLRDPEATGALLALELDALVVAAYGQLLPARLLDGPRLGGVNVHGSLLPRWRGAAPVAAAILNGDAETGVCIMRMDAGLDTGPVYACESLPIASDATTPALLSALAERGARLLTDVLAGLERGDARAVAQEGAVATLAPRLSRADGELSWTMPPAEIDRRVRALTPWPGTTVELGGQRVRLLDGEPEPGVARGAPGSVLRSERDSLVVACGEGAYQVRQVQPPGGRPMDAAAYLRGRRAVGPA